MLSTRRGQGRRLPPTPCKPSTLQLKPSNINFPKLNASPTHVSDCHLFDGSDSDFNNSFVRCFYVIVSSFIHKHIIQHHIAFIHCHIHEITYVIIENTITIEKEIVKETENGFVIIVAHIVISLEVVSFTSSVLRGCFMFY